MNLKLTCLLVCFWANCVAAQNIQFKKEFGTNGIIKVEPRYEGNVFGEEGRQSLTLPNGNVLVRLMEEQSTMLTRLLKDGSVDTSFGIKGFSKPFDISYQAVMEVASNGKILLGGAEGLFRNKAVVYCLNADGSIDRTFGNMGRVVLSDTTSGTPTAYVKAIAADVNGDIFPVVSYYRQDYIKSDVFKLSLNGVQIKSFGEGGVLKLQADNLKDINFILINSKQTLLFGGQAKGSVDNDFIFVQANKNGQIDEDFGVKGWKQIDLGGDDNLTSMVVEPGGGVFAAGKLYGRSQFWHRIGVVGLLPNGSIDLGFGVQGITLIQGDLLPHYAGDIAISSTGKVASYGSGTGNKEIYAQWQLKGDGTVDSTFGSNGVHVVELKESFFLRLVFIEPKNGTTLLTGFKNNDGNWDAAMLKLNQDGNVDSGFGSSGYIEFFQPAKRNYVYGSKALTDGSIIVNSTEYVSSNAGYFLSRYLPDGRIDSAYGDAGIIRIDAQESYAIWDDGASASASHVYETQNKGYIRIRKFGSDGKPDSGFGKEGVLKITPFRGDYPVQMVALPGGKLLLAGITPEGSERRAFLVQIDATGAIDSKFGTNGFVMSSIMNEEIRSLAVDKQGRLVLSTYQFQFFPNYIARRLLKRYLANGKPDLSFGAKGIVTVGGQESSFVTGMFVRPDGKILLQVGFNDQITWLQFQENGKKDIAFGLTRQLLTGSKAALQENGKLILTGIEYDQYDGDAQLQRFAIDSKPDSSFGVAGKMIFDLDKNKNDGFRNVSLKGENLYINGFIEGEDRTEVLVVMEPIDQSNISFTLLNAKTDKDIQTLADGAVINLAAIPGKSINVRANTYASAKSMVMNLSGTQTRTQIENIAPYALFGNTNNNYKNWKPQPGNYALTATPYTKAKGKGEAGTSHTVSFTIVHHLTLSNFTLVHSRTNKDVTTLQDGAVIDLATTPHINIRANTGVGITESVQFTVNGKKWSKAQNHAPFAIASNNSSNYLDWNIKPGTYTITATPYSEDFAKNEAGTPLTITITVIDSRQQVLNTVQRSKTQTDIALAEGLSLKTYPNPTVENAVAEFSLPHTTQVRLVLVDATGKTAQEIYKGTADGGVLQRKTIYTSALKPGLYFCWLLTSDGQTLVSKIIKQ